MLFRWKLRTQHTLDYIWKNTCVIDLRCWTNERRAVFLILPSVHQSFWAMLLANIFIIKSETHGWTKWWVFSTPDELWTIWSNKNQVDLLWFYTTARTNHWLGSQFFSNVDVKFRFRKSKRKSFFITQKTKRIPICKVVKKSPQ